MQLGKLFLLTCFVRTNRRSGVRMAQPLDA